jgi:hypothetical protein
MKRVALYIVAFTLVNAGIAGVSYSLGKRTADRWWYSHATLCPSGRVTLGSQVSEFYGCTISTPTGYRAIFLDKSGVVLRGD